MKMMSGTNYDDQVNQLLDVLNENIFYSLLDSLAREVVDDSLARKVVDDLLAREVVDDSLARKVVDDILPTPT